MPKTKPLRLATVNDFMQVPADQLDDCMAQFKEFLLRMQRAREQSHRAVMREVGQMHWESEEARLQFQGGIVDIGPSRFFYKITVPE